MPRKIFAAVAILLVGGCVVAMVRAQERPSRTTSTLTVADNSSRRERSVLMQRRELRTIESRSEAAGTGVASQPTTGRIADRIQKLRDSKYSDTASSPVASTPSAPAEIPIDEGAGQLMPAKPQNPRISSRPSARRTNRDRDTRQIQSKPKEQSRPANPRSPARTAITPYVKQGSAQIQLSASGPALRVDTVGPAAILIGKTAEYTVTVTNQSPFAADDVFVRIALPEWVTLDSAQASVGTAQADADVEGARRVVWNLKQVQANAREALVLQVTPKQNRAFDLVVDWATRPVSTVAQIEVQQPQLEMSVFGPKDVLYGETAVYTIQLTNPGTGDAENVSVEFAYGQHILPTKRIGSIRAGQQSEVNVELTARQAGSLRVGAVAIASGGLRAEAEEEVLVRRAQLDVDVVGSQRKFAGGVASYQVRVRNTGDATATNVVATVTLPSGAKLIAAQDLQAGTNGLVKQIGPLSPSAERVFELQCQLLNPGDNRIDATAEATSDLVATGSFVTLVEALADLKLVVNDPKGPIAVGADAVFEVIISNRGTKAAEQVKVVGQFSDGVEPIEANGTGANIVPGQVLFNAIPRIPAGQQVTLKITARAATDGNHRFRAVVTSAEPDTRLSAEENTYFFGDDLSRTGARNVSEPETRR